MKQVIFVCLLSLSVCLSQHQQSTPLDATTQNTPVPQQKAAGNETKTNETKPEHVQPAANDASTTKPPAPQTGTQNSTSTNSTQNQTTSIVPNETTTKTNETTPSDKNKSTETKPADATTLKPVDPAKAKNETKPVTPPVPAHNGTTPDGKDNKKNETTTPKGENVSPTAAPVELKSRAFDGPSFIGGIILTLGLLAIGFMGFKYYKNQTERNYHTL